MLRVGKPLIYFISDGSINDQNYEAQSADLLSLLAKVVSANILLAQLREKRLSTGLLLDLARQAVCLTQGSQTKLLINDRLDVAMAAGADGVHLTGRSLPTDVVRDASPPDLLIGVSTHSIDDVRSAALGSADFAVFGPVFDSPGKGPAVGLASVSEAVKAAGTMPVLGLGGIDQTNWRDVLAAGAAGFAAIRLLNDPQDLEKLTADLSL